MVAHRDVTIKSFLQEACPGSGFEVSNEPWTPMLFHGLPSLGFFSSDYSFRPLRPAACDPDRAGGEAHFVSVA